MSKPPERLRNGTRTTLFPKQAGVTPTLPKHWRSEGMAQLSTMTLLAIGLEMNFFTVLRSWVIMPYQLAKVINFFPSQFNDTALRESETRQYSVAHLSSKVVGFPPGGKKKPPDFKKGIKPKLYTPKGCRITSLKISLKK